MVGTDDREWLTGHDTVAAVVEEQIRQLGPGMKWTGTCTAGFRHGDVGWTVDRVLVTLPSGETFTARMTMVFVLELAYWKVAHCHASVGQTNDDLLGFAVPVGIEAVAASVGEERPSVHHAAAGDGTVTLLFSDIEGSTAILDSVGDQRYRRLLAWHYAVVERALREHDGHEVSRQGDGLMLAFSSARRAVRCALAIQERTDAGQDDLPPVRVRIGIHTGEVLRDEDAFFGRTVHYAARVASAAAGREVLASDLVRTLVDGTDGIAFGETREVEMKGFSGRHPVHLVAAI
jgi:class 3 adenylate cyclase